ncbi:T9SS C-terminal target domain-containing protein [Marinilabilia salmonicolor]|uniref:T9SS C-terminal target domain-containing protein n=1 Tax=Marinilabilia salmonicolor TaxID=989 RepID=UPI00029B4753|nr:T9SS C-terminal target domain-containing protein [Marinilabilia salmonicolor]
MKRSAKYTILILLFTLGHSALARFSESSSEDQNRESQGVSVVANNDVISMNENSTSVANVTNNDYGLQNGISQLTISSQPRNGVARVLDDNTISYTPNESFHGTDRLIYRVCNTEGSCDEAEVNIVVADVDYTPKLFNDTVIYYTDSSSVFKVLINDQDLYDKPLNMTIVQDLNKGFSEITDQMSIKLTFTSYFYTTDSLIYQICDNDGDCDQATLFVKPPRETNQPYVIPEAFSPNGDGFNDTFWIPQYDYYQNLSFIVFTRNGIKVFEDSNYQNNWNGFANIGELKGKLVPKGIYFYVLTVTGSSETTKGSVYISY